MGSEGGKSTWETVGRLRNGGTVKIKEVRLMDDEDAH